MRGWYLRSMTTDAIAADFPASEAIAPKLEAFETLVAQKLEEGAGVRANS